MTGKPIVCGDVARFFERAHRTVAAGQDRNAGFLRGVARDGFVAHQADRLRRRSDERQPALAGDLGEVGVLGEEAVAGMDGVGAGDLGGGDDRGDVEVTLARRGRTDADVIIGVADMQRVAVGLGMDGHGLQAHLLARQDDAQRDLAAVGDEDFRDCRHRSRYDSFTAKSFSPYSIGCPFCG